MSTPGVKCVVWDLDDTLWEGNLLEDSAVRLKPRIPEVLEELDRRGILHSIASRNEYDDAIGKLEEFGIAEYFLYPEIGWDAKSVSLQRIRDNIDIGFDTILFLDDRPFEREEVASVHPDVWCVDSSSYLELLDHPRLRPRYVTRDSGRRRRMYLENIARSREQTEFVGPKESFLRQLEMVLEIDEAQESDLLRAEELTYRTNQLNATGKTYTVESLDELRRDGRHKILVCELTDKHGSYGKIGLAVIEVEAGAWTLKLLLFSCRVLPSGVGTVFLSYLRQMAAEQGVRLLADFRDTGRNRMMRVTYMVGGFSEKSQGEDGMVLLENDLTDIPPIPDYIETVIRVDWSKG